ncbi:MAG: porphobilinogen synthase [Bdellovibrionales bacterium]
MENRLMRLRQNSHLRNLCAETEFNCDQLIQPLFVVEDLKSDQDIPGLGETKRNSMETVLKRVEKDLEMGTKQFILFHVPSKKALQGFSHDFSNQVIHKIKKEFGDQIFLWVDTCLCSYTTHGHCGVVNNDGIDLEKTLSEISSLARSYADAGADGISPSDMMDGRVKHIRQALDEAGRSIVPIMSYSTKFASNFYGPFRVAADSSPQKGDRKHYQIDVRNKNDALQASIRCANEGADLLMVKPGMTAIDLIEPIRQQTGKQVGAYQVSGEYAALTLLAEKGLIQFEKGLLETWQVFKRAGTQYIITYGARYGRKLGLSQGQ